MKKLLILMTIGLAGFAANAQPSEVSKKELAHDKREEKREERKEQRRSGIPEASYQSKEQFFIDFGDIPDAAWSREGNFDIVTFTKDGIPQTAYYDDAYTLVGTCTEKTFADLPPSAQKYINHHYGDYEKARVILFNDNEENDTDMILYGTQFEDRDNYFIELRKGKEDFLLRVTPEGNIFWFRTIR